MKSVFGRDMRVDENTSQPANVRTVRWKRTVRALQRAANCPSKKAMPFSTVGALSSGKGLFFVSRMW